MLRAAAEVIYIPWKDACSLAVLYCATRGWLIYGLDPGEDNRDDDLRPFLIFVRDVVLAWAGVRKVSVLCMGRWLFWCCWRWCFFAACYGHSGYLGDTVDDGSSLDQGVFFFDGGWVPS